jgi:hypothetical protein
VCSVHAGSLDVPGAIDAAWTADKRSSALLKEFEKSKTEHRELVISMIQEPATMSAPFLFLSQSTV